MSASVHLLVWYQLQLPVNANVSSASMPTLTIDLVPAALPIKNPVAVRNKAVVQTHKQSVTQVAIKSVPIAQPTATETLAETPEVAVETDGDTLLQPPRFNAQYLNNSPPEYPLAARRRNIEGQVWVRAEIEVDGSCRHAEIKTPSASSLLNQAALEAVKNWRFVPATVGNKTVVAWVDIPVTFKLNN